MPTPRKYATNAARQAAYRARSAMTPPPTGPQPPVTPGARRWTVLIGQARDVLETVAQEMRAYEAARSEAWHDSEHGEQFMERFEWLEEVRGVLDELLEA